MPGHFDQYCCSKRSGSRQMPRSIEGQGVVMARYPPPTFTSLPPSSRIFASMPGKARVAEPGFVATRPGSGVIMIEPVSVCHHVSTIGQRSPPIHLWYHIHASGLIGSPTEPRRRSDDMSCDFGSSSPHFMNARIAVGAV